MAKKNSVEQGLSVAGQILDDERSLALLRQAVAAAADEYHQEVNLPLDVEGIDTANRVVAVAVANLLQNKPVALKTPEDAEALVRNALDQRQIFRLAARQAIADLEEPATPGSEKTYAFTLAIPAAAVRKANDELIRFDATPVPQHLQALIELKSLREKSLPEPASMAWSRVFGVSRKEALQGLNTPYKTGRVDRGLNIGVEALLAQRRELNWLSVGHEQIAGLALAVADEIAKRGPKTAGEKLAIAKMTAEKLGLEGGEEERAWDLFVALSTQFEDLAKAWSRSRQSRDMNSPQMFRRVENFFAGYPLMPDVVGKWILDAETLREEIAAGRKPALHLWGEPMKIEGYALPAPRALAQVETLLRRGDGSDPLAWKIKRAQQLISEHYLITTQYPERIQGETERLMAIVPGYAASLLNDQGGRIIQPELDLKQIKTALGGGQPLTREQLDDLVKMLEQSARGTEIKGQAGALTRQIRYHSRVLTTDAQLMAAAASADDLRQIDDPEIMVIVAEAKKGEMERRSGKIANRLYRLRLKLEQSSWADTLRIVNGQSPQFSLTDELIADQLAKIDGWINAMEAGGNSRQIFPASVFGDDFDPNSPAVKKTLEGKLGSEKERDRAETAIEIFRTKPDQPGFKMNRWILADLRLRREDLAEWLEISREKRLLGERMSRVEEFLDPESDKTAGLPDGLLDGQDQRRVGSQLWVKLRILPADVRRRPQDYAAELKEAERLVALHRAVNKFSFEIPPKHKLNEELEEQRKIPMAQPVSTTRDEFRTRPAVSETIGKLLNKIQEISGKGNPFFPLEEAAGTELKFLVEAADFRIKVARAALALPELKERQIRVKAELETAKADRMAADKIAFGVMVAKKINYMRRKLENANRELLTRMQNLGLAVESELLEK